MSTHPPFEPAGVTPDARLSRVPIRVLIAEDEQPLREALAELLAGEPDLEVVGTASDVDSALAAAEAKQPDVILQDVRIAGGGGARVAREVAGRAAGARLLALSAYEDRASVLAMLRAGAVGYLVKGTTPAEILEAVRRTARGQASLSAELAWHLVDDLMKETEERRDTEKAARRDEARVRALLDSAPDAAVVIDAEGVIVLVNKQTEALFGYERDELVGQPVEKLMPPRFHERHHEHRGSYFRHPRTRPMGAGLELAGLRKNGTDFPVDISLSALETDEGRLATAFIRDATERVEAEETRRRNEERLAQLIESAPDAVVIIDEAGKMLLVNEQTEELFGYTREEIVGERMEMLLPERFRHQHVGHRAGYFASPRRRPMGAVLELAGLRHDGSEFPIDVSLSATDTPDGRVATAWIRDITERKVQAELQQTLAERRALLRHLVSTTEEERQRIAADIHDDSIQVMAAAGMRLQILRRTLDDPTQLRLLATLEETIELSIARLRHLLFELHPPVLDEEGLAAALRVYLDEAEHQSPIRYSLDDRLRNQPSEDARLIIYRIAQESLTNVRKHSQARAARVIADERDGGFLVRITDDGVGFDADLLKPMPGHLGLTAIRERAELVGGWLKITSARGSGTTVEFWIPALPRSAPTDQNVDSDPTEDPAVR